VICRNGRKVDLRLKEHEELFLEVLKANASGLCEYSLSEETLKAAEKELQLQGAEELMKKVFLASRVMFEMGNGRYVIPLLFPLEKGPVDALDWNNEKFVGLRSGSRWTLSNCTSANDVLALILSLCTLRRGEMEDSKYWFDEKAMGAWERTSEMKMYFEARFGDNGPWRVVVAFCLRDGNVEDMKIEMFKRALQCSAIHHWHVMVEEAKEQKAIDVSQATWETWEKIWNLEKVTEKSQEVIGVQNFGDIEGNDVVVGINNGYIHNGDIFYVQGEYFEKRVVHK
jgi:hypothetical protein